MAIPAVEALVFDVFGTVVDWRGGVIAEIERVAKGKGVAIDGAAFADAWRGAYVPSMDRVRRGEVPWTRLDDLHRATLDRLVVQFGLTGLSETETDHLNRVWHRLPPWPDAIEGLSRLKRRYIIATLSNGNVSLLLNMAKNVGLPWDTILSAELVRHYKPDPEAYLGTADLLGRKPQQVMLVAAHNNDLQAAQRCGLRAAFVARPHEHGPGKADRAKASGQYDAVAEDFVDLARQLGA